MQVVVLGYSFKRGQIIRFARGIARARARTFKIFRRRRWRGKGQNKCYGITMDSECSLTLYRGVAGPHLETRCYYYPPLPSPEGPPPPHPSSPRSSISSSFVVASFSPSRSLYLPTAPVALLTRVCLRKRRSRVYKRPRVYVCVSVNMYTGSNIAPSREKKEEGRKE